jgi:hypothetical protein
MGKNAPAAICRALGNEHVSIYLVGRGCVVARVSAHELLAPVNGWFTEGFGTRNLKEAKAHLGSRWG